MLSGLIESPLFLTALAISAISGFVILLYSREALNWIVGKARDAVTGHLTEYIIALVVGGVAGAATVTVYETTIHEHVTKVEGNHSERIAEIERNFGERIGEIEDDFNERIAETRQELDASDEKLIRVRDKLASCLKAHDHDSRKYLKSLGGITELECGVNIKCDDPPDDEKTAFERCIAGIVGSN